MLAGCSSLLSSPRHRLRSDASSLQFQQHQQKMGTQRFDLPCSFPRKEGPRISISLDKPVGARGTCSFMQIPMKTPSSSSSSLVAQQTAPWEARREIEVEGFWEKKKPKSLKRFYDRTFPDDDDDDDDGHAGVSSKRMKGSSSSSTSNNNHQQLAGGNGGEGNWFQHIIPRTVEEEEATFPPLPPSSIAFLAGTSCDTGAGSEGHMQKTGSGSSSDDNNAHCSSSSPGSNEDSSETEPPAHGFETGNGSHIHHPCGPAGATEVTGEGDRARAEQQSLELVSLLMACLESISSRNYVATNYFLSKLGELASPEGTPVHRLVAYYSEALVLRVAKLWPHTFCVAPPRELVDRVDDASDAMAIRVMNHVNPIPKFIHFTLNEMLLKAFEGKDRVHIIDFDIKQGLQWPGLFQSLASRRNPPVHIRITGVGDSKQELQDTSIRLSRLAEALNLPFEFHPVVDRFEDVRFWMLHVKEGECVAVNCVMQLHKALYDDNGGVLMDFLGLIRSTNPAVVLVAEQEAEHNDPRWEMRLARSLPYYSAVFDSIDASLPMDSPARIKVEEMFAREIRNIVSCEGHERVERHQGFSDWRRMMEERGGFRCVGVGEREMLQSRMLLQMFPSEKYYSMVKQGGGGGELEDNAAGLTLKWLEQPLYTVSAWAPADVAASSTTSTASQPV